MSQSILALIFVSQQNASWLHSYEDLLFMGADEISYSSLHHTVSGCLINSFFPEASEHPSKSSSTKEREACIVRPLNSKNSPSEYSYQNWTVNAQVRFAEQAQMCCLLRRTIAGRPGKYSGQSQRSSRWQKPCTQENSGAGKSGGRFPLPI